MQFPVLKKLQPTPRVGKFFAGMNSKPFLLLFSGGNIPAGIHFRTFLIS